MPRTSTRRGDDFLGTFADIGTGTPPFSLNAPSRGGQGPYGTVPGNIGLPPVYQDIAGVFPGLTSNINALSGNIASELAGELDPQTIAMLQNTAAQFGIGAGVPLSPFSGAAGLRHLGQTVEAQKAKGAQDLLTSLPTLAKTLTISPETQLEVANRNATLNAAPDPAQAAREAQRLFDLYMAKLQRGGGGGVSYSPSTNRGAPQNLNVGPSFSPWGTMPVQNTYGTRADNPYQGIPPSNQRAPQDLWSDYVGGFPGPEGGIVANPGSGGSFKEWFNDPFLGGGGGMFGYGPSYQNAVNDVYDWFGFDNTPQQPQYPDFPEWDY